MSRTARRLAFTRLGKEYEALTKDAPEGIVAGPRSEEDYFTWTATFAGPEGTPFEGGVFEAELKFPEDYPLKPPEMRFLDRMWHPNGTFLFSKEHGNGRFGANVSKKCIPMGKFAYLFCILPATIQTTMSLHPSAGHQSKVSKRY
jgi:hypothetical protein